MAGERASEESRDAYRRAAFVGWQVRSAVVGSLGAKGGGQSFGAYAQALGLEVRGRAPAAATSERARENAEKVRAAFAKHGVRRVE